MRALEGVKVVSLAVNLPGPVCAQRLHEFGASVVTVIPLSGDPMEHYCGPYYDQLHEAMDVRRADLKSEAGQAEVHQLLAAADMLITSSRPSALRRLGLGWDDLTSRYPRLNQVAIVGYPGDGAEVAGHDLTYQASMGLLSPPELPRTLISDLVGGERAASTALALFIQSQRTGVGAYAEVALSDAADTMAQPHQLGLTAEGGLLGGGTPHYRVYAAATGWVALAALEPHFLRTALAELGVDGSVEQFEAVFQKKTAAEWEAWANERDIPLCAVLES